MIISIFILNLFYLLLSLQIFYFLSFFHLIVYKTLYIIELLYFL